MSTGCQASERQGSAADLATLLISAAVVGPRPVWTYTIRYVVWTIDRRPQRWLRQLRASRA